jgi:hypothetical protein
MAAAELEVAVVGADIVGLAVTDALAAAFAQRFIHPELAEAEEGVEKVEEVDIFVLKEVRAITERLRALEAEVERRRPRKE